jgi:hypothetical protein
VRQGSVRGRQQPLHVDRDHPVPFGEVSTNHGAEQHDACVVDQVVEASEPLDGLCHRSPGLATVGDVGLDGQGGAAVLADVDGQAVESVLAAGHE